MVVRTLAAPLFMVVRTLAAVDCRFGTGLCAKPLHPTLMEGIPNPLEPGLKVEAWSWSCLGVTTNLHSRNLIFFMLNLAETCFNVALLLNIQVQTGVYVSSRNSNPYQKRGRF